MSDGAMAGAGLPVTTLLMSCPVACALCALNEGLMPAIPSLAHFVWLGSRLPWVHALSPLTAAARGGFDRVILWHTDDPGDDPSFAVLQRGGTVELRRLDPLALAEATGGPQLAELYHHVTRPAARADILRVALLHEHGGVYLDMDTVTVGPLAPLGLGGGAYVGAERIVFPPRVTASRRPDVLAGALLRHGARELMRRLPDGWRWFRRLERFYALALNNAVFASEPRHPFVAELLSRLGRLAPSAKRGAYALGPHLLEATAFDFRARGLQILPPALFFPLGPEIAEHWVRPSRGALAAALLLPETRVVHWYASTRARRFVVHWTPRAWRDYADTQPLAWLAARALDGAEAPSA
jgi:hypothetical protein